MKESTVYASNQSELTMIEFLHICRHLRHFLLKPLAVQHGAFFDEFKAKLQAPCQNAIRIERELVKIRRLRPIPWGNNSQARLPLTQSAHMRKDEKKIPARLQDSLCFANDFVVAIPKMLDHTERPIPSK